MERIALHGRDMLQTAVEAAARHIESGGVIAAPTETVYGLMTLWDNAVGRERIYQMKKRPSEKRLQMLAGDLGQAEAFGVLADVRLRAIAAAFWPGALTVVCGGADGDTVGLRIPHHAFMHELLMRLGAPLAATSANPSGQPAAAEAAAAVRGLDGSPDLLIDGGTIETSAASTVVSLIGDKVTIIREGPVALAAIEAALAACLGGQDALPRMPVSS